MKINSRITPERILDACESDRDVGFCIECGEESDEPVEPDAREYKCGVCGARAVFGAQELAIMMF